MGDPWAWLQCIAVLFARWGAERALVLGGGLRRLRASGNGADRYRWGMSDEFDLRIALMLEVEKIRIANLRDRRTHQAAIYDMVAPMGAVLYLLGGIGLDYRFETWGR